MDTKALRQKILDLAIRGKLVPQDPNDEPASVLLERIRAEKERLIAEGKIKRPKKSKASSSESHYQKLEIPNSWEWTTLGEIFSMQAGKNIQASKLKEYSDEAPYPCYGGNGIRGYLPKYNHEGLYPIVGRQGALCGNINMASGKFYATEHAVVVDYFANTEPLLWRYFLEFLNLNQYATATAQPGLSVAKIEEVPIPLPPIQEQTRIIKAVESWFERITLLEKNIISLNECISTIKSKILELAMQGKLIPQDPADEPATDMLRRVNPKARIITDNPHYPQLPDNWAWISIEDLNEYKPKSINPAESSSEIFDLYSVPIFPTGHPEKVIGKEIGSTKQSVLHNDVLLCKINPHLNRVWTIEDVSDNMQIASSEWIVIRSSSTYSTYLRWMFSSPFFRELLCSQVSGVGGSLTRAQPAVVKKYLIPIPPYKEQIRIVNKINSIFSKITEINSNLGN